MIRAFKSKAKGNGVINCCRHIWWLWCVCILWEMHRNCISRKMAKDSPGTHPKSFFHVIRWYFLPYHDSIKYKSGSLHCFCFHQAGFSRFWLRHYLMTGWITGLLLSKCSRQWFMHLDAPKNQAFRLQGTEICELVQLGSFTLSWLIMLVRLWVWDSGHWAVIMVRVWIRTRQKLIASSLNWLDRQPIWCTVVCDVC